VASSVAAAPSSKSHAALAGVAWHKHGRPKKSEWCLAYARPVRYTPPVTKGGGDTLPCCSRRREEEAHLGLARRPPIPCCNLADFFTRMMVAMIPWSTAEQSTLYKGHMRQFRIISGYLKVLLPCECALAWSMEEQRLNRSAASFPLDCVVVPCRSIHHRP